MEMLIKDQELVLPGDHMVLLYNEEKEVVETIVSYINASLLRNEKCIYITGDANTQIIIDLLNETINYEYYIDRGQFVILNQKDAYSKSGIFVPDKMISLLIAETNNAISEGYNGVSISGELSWVLQYEDGIERIIEYEWKLNEYVFNNAKLSAICRYNMKKFSDEMIINIIQLHPYLIWKNQIHENPFYIPPIGYKEKKIAEYQVKVWLENITKYTNTKSKFHKEIKSKEEEFAELQLKLTKEIIMSITGLLEIHDSYTKNHSETVANISKMIAKELKLSEELIAKTYYTGVLHDIGKTIISKDILNKNDRLTESEYDVVKMHPISAYETLTKSSELTDIADYVLYHHERWDGKGYPEGISDEKIPFISRIIAVADTYDAMTTDRPYRKALSSEIALQEIINNSSTQFDPKVVKVFVEKVYPLIN